MKKVDSLTIIKISNLFFVQFVYYLNNCVFFRRLEKVKPLKPREDISK